ncbi:MAG: hypothetical protein NVS3B21_08910 [Acidimicrobiales bacterium]
MLAGILDVVAAARGVVSVWVADVGDVVDVGRHCAAVELESAAGRRSGRRWLAARTVLRSVLGTALDTEPVDLVIEIAPSGKPHLAHWDTQFSLSHSGDLVAVAVCRDRPVGIDIEAPRILRRPERLARRILNSGEYDRWSGQLDPCRTQSLLQQWTRMEAVLKATGEGVGAGMRGAVERQVAGGWAVRDLALHTGVGAVASPGSDWELVVRRWEVTPGR